MCSFCFVNLEIDYHHDVVGDYAEQESNSGTLVGGMWIIGLCRR